MHYICPKTESCSHKFCPHSQAHDHKEYTCAGNACGCPGCIPVSGDKRPVVPSILFLLLILLGIGIVAHIPNTVLQNAIVPCDSIALADSLDRLEITSIIRILDGETEPNGLQQAWPTAALDMQEIGRQYRINPVILAVLARAEGGLRNPMAVRRKNAFGISRNGKMLTLPSFRYGCDRAAKIVSMSMGEDSPNYIYPDADYWSRLAAAYGPENKKRWATNCRKIWSER